MNLQQLVSEFTAKGCDRLIVKCLQKNHTGKQQVYIAKGFGALTMLPMGEVVPSADGRAIYPVFHAPLDLVWLNDDSTTEPASGAQLILYSKYPEVRLSALIEGTTSSRVKRIMNSPVAGRILFLGIKRKVTGDPNSSDGIITYISDHDEALTAEYLATHQQAHVGGRLNIIDIKVANNKDRLLAELKRIHLKEFIPAKILSAKNGLRLNYAGTNAGGTTLEAELNITQNSKGEPDYLGWELKQHSVKRFDSKSNSSKITLMTPEPTGGIYTVDKKLKTFMERYGKGDITATNRQDFNGAHKFNTPKAHGDKTLTLKLVGYDTVQKKMTDKSGAIVLVEPDGTIAASWLFTDLMNHWKIKHHQAAYVPSILKEKNKNKSYHYGYAITLAEGADFDRFLEAVAQGRVIYDPGINMKLKAGKLTIKKRSQFRISMCHINMLYTKVSVVNLNSESISAAGIIGSSPSAQLSLFAT